jgi:glyoxylase I family protein
VHFVLHHVAISVKDLDESFAFYERFGFHIVSHWKGEGGSFDIVNMKLGDYLMEVFRFKDHREPPEAMSDLSTDLPTIGTKHHGVRVADVDAAYEWAIDQGLTPESGVVQGRTGVRYFFIKDPSGNFFEIAEDHRPFMAAITT